MAEPVNLTSAQVSGNIELARIEGNRQLAAATKLMQSQVVQDHIAKLKEAGKYSPTEQLHVMRSIAAEFPAITAGFREPTQLPTPGQPLQVSITYPELVIDPFWPWQPPSISSRPPVAEPILPIPPGATPPSNTPRSPTPPPPSGQPIVPPSTISEPIIGDPVVNGGGVNPRPGSPSGIPSGTPGSGPNGTPPSGGTGSNVPSTRPGKPNISEPPASSSGTGSGGTPTNGTGTVPINSGGSKGLGAEGLANMVISPKDNVLDSYDSYTYNVALYMLTPKEYVKMLKNPMNPQSAKKILICRSGGVGNDGGKEFDVDFYLDDLKMKNMATSPSKSTTNTNAVDISFIVHEPRGITFIERLKEQAKEALEEEQSYIATPYLLEIKFKGYDEFGKPVESIGKPKYIPIKINEMRFYIEEGGASYQCKAAPYHHDVFSNIRSFIPINVQVKAGTVGDVLTSKAQTSTTETTREVDDDAPDGFWTFTKTTLGEKHIDLATAVNAFFKSQTKKTKSYTDPKTKKKVTVEQEAGLAEVWKFKMAPDIFKAKIITERISALNSPQKTQNLYKQYGSSMKGKVELDATNKYFTVNKGTSIVQLINYIIVGSTYITKPLVDKKNANENSSTDPIKWFKVIPEITNFIGWDKKEGRYKFEITWNVQTTAVYYSDYPHASSATPNAEGVHKIYDYMFTGKNTQITNLRLDFQSAYYEAQQLGTGNPTNDKDLNTRSPMRKVLTTSSEGQTVNNDDTIGLKRAKDLMTSIMHDGVSMQELNMGIIGDPAFLPTGDGFWQPQGNGGSIYTSPFLPDGTINYDITPPYVQLNFKTPTGYDDISGLADPSDPQNKKYSSDEFNGIYQVFQVESTFTGGMFSQQMIAIKTKMQPINDKVGRSGNSRNSLANTERAAIASDSNNIGQTLPWLSGSASSSLAKITSLAKSSITNIATNTIPQNLSGSTTELEQNVARIVSEIGGIVQRILPEQAGDPMDLLVDESGFDANAE